MMKKIRNYLMYIATFFAMLTLLESCVVYQKTSVSLAQAAKENKRSKVEMRVRETYRFQRIVFENGQFYGIKKGNDLLKVPLREEDISKVRLQDYSTSTIATIATAVVSVLGGLLLLYFIDTGGGDWLDFSE